MNYVDLLAVLSKETKLELHAASQSGSCTIRFDEKVDVTIEADQNGALVQLYAPLGEVAAAVQETVFPLLLQIHLLGIATDDAYFGFQPTLGKVVFFKSLRLSHMDAGRAVKSIESFVSQAMRWTLALPSLADGTLGLGGPAGNAQPVTMLPTV